MEEWKTYKVGDICSSISETYKSKSKSVVLINTSDVLEGRCLNHEFVPNKDLKGQFKKVFKFGDILYSEIRPANKRFAYIDFDATDYIASTKLMVLRNNDKVTNRFLYHYLKSESTIAELQALAESRSGTFPQITFSELSQLEISIPDIETQLAISSFIDTLESKIELNRQINDNLEQQAQVLYKSWFTDFEPFKNGKFIESELGLIPEGWKVGKIKDIISLLSGFPFKSSDFVQNGDYRLITIKGVQDGYLDVTSADRLSSFPPKMPEYCILNIGDILISLTGNVGRICIVDRNKLLLNQRVAILAPKDPRDSFYTYTMFRSESFKNELIHLARGTAQLNLSPIETGDKLTVIPPDSVLEAFAKISKGTFDQYISIKMENIRLSEMRDTLLPKLISGELKINEIDC